MIIAIEICQDNFIYCKIWTQNLDVKTSKKPKERVKNQKIQCLKIIETKQYIYIYIWLHNRNKNIGERWVGIHGLKNWRISIKTYYYIIEKYKRKIGYLKRIIHDYSNWKFSRQFHILQNMNPKFRC